MRTLLERLEIMPPNKVRLLARRIGPRGRRFPIPLTTDEIATKSGLSIKDVKRISRMNSWLDVSVENMLRFFSGCGIEPLHLEYPLKHLKRTDGLKRAAHLRVHQPKFYQALMEGRKDWRAYTKVTTSISAG